VKDGILLALATNVYSVLLKSISSVSTVPKTCLLVVIFDSTVDAGFDGAELNTK